jgi:adenylate cyclase
MEEARIMAGATVDQALCALDLEGNAAGPLQVGAVGLAALGQAEEAREWISRATELERDDHNVKYNAACTYALIGEAEKARVLLTEYLKPLGPDEANWCQNDPDLASARVEL